MARSILVASLALVLLATAVPDLTAGDVVYPPGAPRSMRLVVDLDAEFSSRLSSIGLDPVAKAQQWVDRAVGVWKNDTNIRVVVTQVHVRSAADNLADPVATTLADKPHNYIDVAWAAWQGVGEHDVVLLLSGKDFGSAGVGKQASAGRQDMAHVAIVKETADNVARISRVQGEALEESRAVNASLRELLQAVLENGMTKRVPKRR